MAEIDLDRLNQVVLEFGGVRFETYYTINFGSSTRLFGKVNDEWVEMMRFDDFVDIPHYHQPADDDTAIMVKDTVAEVGIGEPMEYYLNIIANELPERLPACGFGDVLPSIDFERVRLNLPAVRLAMHTVLPEGFSRPAGQLLQDSVVERVQMRADMFAAAQAALVKA